MLRTLTPFVLFSLLLVAACAEQPPSSPNAATDAANHTDSAAAQAVELQIMDYDGVQKLIQSHQGKVVVLDCWSTSCGPCVREFPNLVALQKKHGDKVACVSLSFDYDGLGKPEDKHGDVLEFLQKQGATFDNVLSSESDEDLSKKMGFASIPVVFVYDREGKLAKRFDNEDAQTEADLFTYEHVSALVEQLAK